MAAKRTDDKRSATPSTQLRASACWWHHYTPLVINRCWSFLEEEASWRMTLSARFCSRFSKTPLLLLLLTIIIMRKERARYNSWSNSCSRQTLGKCARNGLKRPLRPRWSFGACKRSRRSSAKSFSTKRNISAALCRPHLLLLLPLLWNFPTKIDRCFGILLKSTCLRFNANE